MKRVAITGISGYLGCKLAHALNHDPDIELILGLDVRPPPFPLSKLTFVRHDVSRPFGHLFLEHWIDTAVHLAFCTTRVDRIREEQVNLTGTDQFLEAAHRAGILRLLVASCASVYGAEAGQPSPVGEDAPLRGGETGYRLAADKVAQEARCIAFELEHPEVRLLRVRPAPVLGPGSSHDLARALTRRLLLLPRRMGALQVCHVDDLVRAVHGLLRGDCRGVFNIAPDDAVPADELGPLLARRSIRVPRRALRALTRVGWERGLPKLGDAPPEALAYFESPYRVSSRRLQQELGFGFSYSSRQTLEVFARSQGGWQH